MVDRADDSGQWLLLMAVVAGAGLAILLIMVNQSVMAGYSSSSTMLDFPKNDLREIRAETIGVAREIGTTVNKEDTIPDKKSHFEERFNQYSGDLSRIYSLGGTEVVITCKEITLTSTDLIEKITLHIYYNNGETEYEENVDIYLI